MSDVIHIKGREKTGKHDFTVVPLNYFYEMENVKPAGWGSGYDFADKLGLLGLGYYLDDEREYDIYVGDGGPESAFFHHYIVVDSPDLPDGNRRIVFELAKGSEASSCGALVPGVRIYSGGGLKYHITVRATLRCLL